MLALAPTVRLLVLASGVLAGCGIGDPGGAGLIDAALDDAPSPWIAANPATGGWFIHEPGRSASELDPRRVSVAWGRRVDVYAPDLAGSDPARVLQDVVIGPGISSGAGRELSRSLATGGWKLSLAHAPGTSAFAAAIEELESGLVELEPAARDEAADEVAVLPSDAALVLRFDGLLAEGWVGPETVRLQVGDPPLRPVEAQAFADPSHGALGHGRFLSSRAIVASQLPATGVRLSIRVPGHAGAASEVVREFRATGGRMDDVDPPYVVGRLRGEITQVRPSVNPLGFVVDFTFSTQACAVALRPGDALLTPGHAAEVLAATSAPFSGALKGIRVLLVSGNPATYAPAGAELRSRWDPALGAPPECFVRFVPPAQSMPARGVSTAATVHVAFSEPMALSSVQALGTFRLAYGSPPDPNPLFAHVVGSVIPSVANDEFAFSPALPLRHAAGTGETYHVQLAGGPQGVTDVAGNPLAFDLPQTSFTLEPGQAEQATSGLALTFAAADEDGDGGAELRGELLYDLRKGLVKGRPVTRFSKVLDTTEPLVGAMFPYGTGIQTPLSVFGSKLMSAWRYIDMGFSLLDSTYHDLDVEGLNWAPSGSVAPDQFTQFRMALAHGRFLTDEAVDAGLLPVHKDSGLVPTFDSNLLSPAEDPLTVVHPKSLGYTINPLDTFVASTGTVLHPWPLNHNLPLNQFTYWTWRDTAKIRLGGSTLPQGGVGADPQRLMQITGIGLIGFYPKGNIPTIALPLLTEFRCYPDHAALGLNAFKVSFALNTSYKPTFRAYSTGGSYGGVVTLVDPDNEPVAQGGINPATGLPTLPIDNTFYQGQADFVIRVSRGHTRWLDTGGTIQFAPAVVEPSALLLPPGTQAIVSFRGASALSGSPGQPWLDAGNLDPYGDSFTSPQLAMLGLSGNLAFNVTYFPSAGDKSWKPSLPDLDGARYVQARVSLISNAATNAVAELSGLGLAFTD